MSVKITELPELDALADADIAVSVDSSELVEANKTKRITWLNIIEYIKSKILITSHYNYTADHTITTAQFGASLRMNSADDKIFTLPSVGESEDGGRLTLIKTGNGKVTIQAVDTDIIGDSSATGTAYTTSAGAAITLEYVHSIATWIIVCATGTWTTT